MSNPAPPATPDPALASTIHPAMDSSPVPPGPHPLPPDTSGPPLLGETLAFLKNGFDFVESRARRHGPIFRTRILGRNTAVIVGPDACTLWINPDLIWRQGSQPGFYFTTLTSGPPESSPRA